MPKRQPNQRPPAKPKTNFWQGAKFPLAVAHRGGDAAGFAKRNTMAAFSSADKLGYKYLETDVTSTKDGQVIISHGAQTGIEAYFRGTFSFKTLRNFTYDEIKQSLRVDGEPIPLLKDVLLALPNSKFLIDPKSDEVAEPLAKLLLELKVLDRVLINSFEYHRLMKIQQLLDNKAELGFLIGLHPSLIKKLYRLRLGRLSHLEALSINHWLGSRLRLSSIHKQDLKAIVWTVNSPRAIKRVIANGADVIISDRISLLEQILRP